MSLLKKMALLAIFVSQSYISADYAKPATIDEAASRLGLFAAASKDPEIAQSLLDLQQASYDMQTADKPKILTKKQAEATFSLIDKSLGQIVLAKGKKAFRGSQDSDQDCDECIRLIRDVRSFLKSCCKALHHEVGELSDLVEKTFPCTPPIAIYEVPVVIDQPGHYCVVNDLYNGYSDCSNAIVIAANNVYLDFDGHVLYINPDTVGIFAQNQSNVFIANGTIQAVIPSTNFNCRGITLINVTQGQLDDMTVLNTMVGVDCGDYDFATGQALPGVTDFTITNCFFNLPSSLSTWPVANLAPIGIRAVNSQGLTVDTTVFGQLGLACAAVDAVGIFGLTNCKNSAITNCQFVNSNSSAAKGIIIQGVQNRLNEATSEGTLIDGCTFYNTNSDIILKTASGGSVDAVVRNCASSNAQTAIEFEGRGLYVENYVASQKVGANSFQLVLLGLAPQIIPGAFPNPVPFPSFDAAFNNCSFSCINQVAAGALFNAQAIDGLLVQDCVFDSNGIAGAQMAIGQGVLNSNNVKVFNCVFQGNAQYNIVASTTAAPNNRVFIEDCVIDGGQQAGIFLDNTLSAYINNCSIANMTGSSGFFGHGINMTATTQYNTIKNCVIANNFGTGILVNAGSDYHFVTDNKVNGNGAGIQTPTGMHSQFYRNQACNNIATNSDCVGIAANLVGAPGSLVFQLGQNICCTNS